MRTHPRVRTPVALRFVAKLFPLALAACASLTPEQQAAVAKVQVIQTEPEQRCQNLGAVSGSRESSGAGGLRANAVLLGANTVRVGASSATAFYCPPPAGPKPVVTFVGDAPKP
jgi:hypothetical protein